jgi:hypothetical protein
MSSSKVIGKPGESFRRNWDRGKSKFMPFTPGMQSPKTLSPS